MKLKHMDLEIRIAEKPEKKERTVREFLWFPVTLRNGSDYSYSNTRWLEWAYVRISKNGAWLSWQDEWCNCSCDCSTIGGVVQTRTRGDERQLRCTNYGKEYCKAGRLLVIK